MTIQTATRYIGFCPICEEDFKLNEGKFVHHGFRRPGDGYIHGDCFAVGKSPYEVSADVCREYIVAVQLQIKDLETRLGQLRAGEVKTVCVAWSQTELTVVNLGFHSAWEYRVSSAEHGITSCKREIERMQKHIEAWTAKPIRTFEEELEKERAAKAVRIAERDAKRAVKAAKEAAKQATRERREAEMYTLRAKYLDVFQALDKEPVQQYAVYCKHWVEMHKAMNKKGYLHFSVRDMNLDEAFLKFGLAYYQNGRLCYKNRDGY